MAIYHLTANIISRARGQRVVAAAAYRAGASLHDERYGVTHNYLGKHGTVHSEIMAPAGSPAWVHDRDVLWNRVEASEFRKDSQLARVIEVGLPVELSTEECVALVRDYAAKEFVAKGMIADFSIRGTTNNPHAHILLTLRRVTASGFGPKERRWNGKSALLEWRSAWATQANEHLARAGHAVRIDHRTLEAQQIELMPGRRIGAGRARQGDEAWPSHVTERIAEQQQIAKENGRTILEDPTVALRALTHQKPIFTDEDLARFLRSRTENAAQFDAVLRAVTLSKDLVALDSDESGRGRFTSRDMIEAGNSLIRRTVSMVARHRHGVASDRRTAAFKQFSMDEAQRRAFEYLVSEGDVKAIAVTDATKDTLLAAARHAWDSEGMIVKGAALSGPAAERLVVASGINALSLAKCEEGWQQGLALPDSGTVLLIDGSQMIGLKQLERVLAVADNARAKLVLVADSDRLQAMRVDSPFLSVLRQVGSPPF
ncbi:MAG TPA: MobQ family relaxase [Steroidobacteraceae bacterium]|nr:MobQ family relaxase [Steroidobacteraceae bacterium]